MSMTQRLDKMGRFETGLNVYPVLLAGGIGSRMWPVSRELSPKQLIKFTGEDSFLQSAIKRLAPALDTEKVRIVCGDKHFDETVRQIEEIGVRPAGKIITEPCGRNTAPAILLAVLNIIKDEKDAILSIFPADHIIRDIDIFHRKLKSAILLADKGYIVTFGIMPNYPETGYGYIEGGKNISDGALTIKRFVEKPDIKTAKEYIKAGNFFWNSGMFTFRASVILDEFKVFAPELVKRMNHLVLSQEKVAKNDYEKLTSISIDYAVMEKTDKGAVLPSDFGWSDIGSWKALYDFLEKDADNNVIKGDVIAKKTRNCLIIGKERLVTANCLENMVVVETSDSILISNMNNTQDIKTIVTELKEKKRKEY
ncbi:MAG: mannose-1-phosphate guanylyltransferase/mannose-6-phosphate isomerase [Deltaproteobacteria bacterium]|nr:mannose-1-phosphate guanylyltransferase/mannose-6-phosphate isomerase [Deltaproteobacteria bacterium]